MHIIIFHFLLIFFIQFGVAFGQIPSCCSPYKQIFDYTGNDQQITIPSCVETIKVKIWGAGGGGSSYNLQNAGGGAGGYVEGIIAVNSGDVFSIMVGEGGACDGTVDNFSYGFGGKYSSLALGGFGGGLSGLFSGSATIGQNDQSRALLIAGGGGGSERDAPINYCTSGGQGGDVVFGGGMPNMHGEDGGVKVGGGAGGGYNGGLMTLRLSGNNIYNAGEGGTNFIHGSVINGISLSSLDFGNWNQYPLMHYEPPNTTDVDYSVWVNSSNPGIGNGSMYPSYRAGHGRVVIEFFPIYNPPIADAGSDQSICLGQSTSLTGTGGTTYQWAGGPATDTYAVSPPSTTTYTVTAYLNGCSASDDITITVIPNITPTFNSVTAICSGSTLLALPTTSNNNITGTWSPVLNNTVTTMYTFTPFASQCATTTTLTITVIPNITPTFNSVAAICSGATLAALPATSNNSINGAWSPVLNNTATTIYTFTPAANQCAVTTTLNITVSAPVLPIFSPIANVCQNATAPVLPTTSTNAFTGTWSPAVSTATTGPTTYTFTPSAGMCATNTTLTITIDTPVTPTFSPVANVCQNATAPVLPNTSTNSTPFNGIWSPAVSTAVAGPASYTFTPAAGQCAANATLTVTVDAPTIPTFAPVSDICLNSTVPVLPSSSTNSTPITGAWSPVVSSAVAGTATYTFTPTSGQCAANATLNIITTSTITPTFAAIPNVCQNATAPVLPVSSTNVPAISGVWAPAVSTATLGASTYTFTPNAGQCGVNTTLDITVSTPVLPTFTPIANVCQNATAPVLLTTSLEAITGSWSPAVSTATTGPTTYTFTPSAGMCATNTTLDITIDTPVLPAFTPISSVCQNATAPVLQGTSTNSITGTWSPAVSTASAGTATYTFTPTIGQCASATTLSITVNAPTTPTFSAIADVCQNSTAPVLPTSSTNAINGAWAPAVSTLSAGTGVYTFTPSGGQCATNTTLNINVIPLVTPTFAAIASVCQNSTAPVLNTSSTNIPAIVGTWSPAVSTALAGTATYTFTPTASVGVCAVNATANITVTPLILPLFETPTPLCQGAMAPVLPTSSNNIPAIMGTWSPAVTAAVAGTFSYTFTPTAGQCTSNATLSMVIKPNPVLLVTDPAPICAPGEVDLTSPQLTAGSTGTITLSSSPTGIPVMSNPSEVSSSGTYFVMSNLNGCVVSSPITVLISASPIASFIPSETILDQYNLTSVMVNSSTGASSYEWFFMDGGTSSETDPSHIFPDSIYGDQLITLIATSVNGCKDTTSKIVTINEELIFYIPNAFTPDGDKYNQTFQPVFRSGFDPNDFTMLLYNRWGEVIFESHDAAVGWDGTFGGNMVQDDVITWVIEFKIIRKDKHVRYTGHVNILR